MKTFGAQVRTNTTKWMACYVPGQSGELQEPAAWLADCHLAGDALPEGPARGELAATITRHLKGFPGRYTSKQCSRMHKPVRKGFLGDELGAVCQAIKDDEKRAKSLAKTLVMIERYKKKNQFEKARSELAKLATLGATKWQVESAVQAIDQAEIYAKDKAARAAAKKRAKNLLRRVPSLEATCKRMSRQWDYAVAQIKAAVKRGKPDRAEHYRKEKAKAGAAACAAKRDVYEAFQIYKSQGNSVAADQVLSTARTCHRVWTCK